MDNRQRDGVASLILWILWLLMTEPQFFIADLLLMGIGFCVALLFIKRG